MIPYPDVTRMPDELGQAVCRMVRLVNEMRRRYPDLDRFALSTESEIDHKASTIVVEHIQRLAPGFELMISPWDGRQFLAGKGHDGPLPPVADKVADRVAALRAGLPR